MRTHVAMAGVQEQLAQLASHVDADVATWIRALAADGTSTASAADGAGHVAGKPAARHVKLVLSMLSTFQRRLRTTRPANAAPSSGAPVCSSLPSALRALRWFCAHTAVPSFLC